MSKFRLEIDFDKSWGLSPYQNGFLSSYYTIDAVKMVIKNRQNTNVFNSDARSLILNEKMSNLI